MYGKLPADGSLVPTSNNDRYVYTVSRLNRDARESLEGVFPRIWVEGEISNLSRPGSGHWYFTLKDDRAQVRCAMFRGHNQKLGFNPENGHHVQVRGRISLYEARGDYQLIADHMEEAGAGALQRAFEELRLRLGTEGLFDQQHKQKLPMFPHAIGVVTSPTGAAIRDIISVLKRRFPALPVIIYPTVVQGQSAAADIAAAIELAGQRYEQHNECDVLVVARGGGSLEDLWSFNDEKVARAIFHCPIPVVTGIGHEIDTTIADFVADVRAPTPSGAAELISPDQNELLMALRQYRRRLYKQEQEHRNKALQQLLWLSKRLQQLHPGQRLLQQAQRLDELDQRLRRSIQQQLQNRQLYLNSCIKGFKQQQPLVQINHLNSRFSHLSQLLQSQVHRRLEHLRQRLNYNVHTLDAVSPLATLGRGYSILHTTDGQIVRQSSSIKAGQQLDARLGKGRLRCTVDKTYEQ